MQKVYTIFILFWLSVGSLWAQPESDLQIGIDRFRAGQRIWNAPVMETARAEFAAVARRAPGTYLPLYWQSVSEFYLLLCYGLEDSSGFDPKKAEALLGRAEETMKAAIAARPQEAECHAMLSSVYGFRIMRHPFSAVWNGPKVLSLQSDALENDPNNPRVLYIIGAGYFRAPKLFRNTDKARELIEQAKQIFEQTPESKDPAQPRWGKAECYGLLGDVYRGQGDWSAARDQYEAALRVNPEYVPAQRGLKEINDGK